MNNSESKYYSKEKFQTLMDEYYVEHKKLYQKELERQSLHRKVIREISNIPNSCGNDQHKAPFDRWRENQANFFEIFKEYHVNRYSKNAKEEHQYEFQRVLQELEVETCDDAINRYIQKNSLARSLYTFLRSPGNNSLKPYRLRKEPELSIEEELFLLGQ